MQTWKRKERKSKEKLRLIVYRFSACGRMPSDLLCAFLFSTLISSFDLLQVHSSSINTIDFFSDRFIFRFLFLNSILDKMANHGPSYGLSRELERKVDSTTLWEFISYLDFETIVNLRLRNFKTLFLKNILSSPSYSLIHPPRIKSHRHQVLMFEGGTLRNAHIMHSFT